MGVERGVSSSVEGVAAASFFARETGMAVQSAVSGGWGAEGAGMGNDPRQSTNLLISTILHPSFYSEKPGPSRPRKEKKI